MSGLNSPRKYARIKFLEHSHYLLCNVAGCSSLVADNPHKVNAVGSNPTPATRGPVVERSNTADSKSAEPGFEPQSGPLDNHIITQVWIIKKVFYLLFF